MFDRTYILWISLFGIALTSCSKKQDDSLPPIASPTPFVAEAIVTPYPTPKATPTPFPTPRIEYPKTSISDDGYKLILEHEVGGGKPYYDRYLARPNHPPESSGITIGVGYDLGYNTKSDLLQDWEMLDAKTLQELQIAIGYTGKSAHQFLSQLQHILIKWGDAELVFNKTTLTKFILLTRRTYTGFDELLPNAQAALVSMTFNRGTSMQGERRKELREIKRLVPLQDYQGIANQIRLSKRLWQSGNANGLLRRREDEAKLVESCIISKY